jgi:AraC-like DNA-binding protein
MNQNQSDRYKYDPSSVRQSFSDVKIQLHCCRYWMVSEWECSNLASPFWRLYHNTQGEASVVFSGVTTRLRPDRIVVIPPNTPFSTLLKSEQGPVLGERHTRRKVSSWSELRKPSLGKSMDHLFIHFNLGLPYDLHEPGVFEFPVTDHLEALLRTIKTYCMDKENAFDYTVCAAINGLIASMLEQMPPEQWAAPKMDHRVAAVLNYIEKHMDSRISNKLLADKGNMAENSFARLFKESVGLSIQQYIKRKRIDKALILMHHDCTSIDAIAQECGFSDRSHFSRVFREVLNTSPANYRKTIF